MVIKSMILSKEELIKRIKDNKDIISSFGVKNIGIFGSFARNEAKEDSDIDIIVEFEKGKATFKNVGGLIDFLEKLFKRNIDLLTPDGIESIRIKYLREQIKREVEFI